MLLISIMPVVTFSLTVVIPNNPFVVSDIDERVSISVWFILCLWYLPYLHLHDVAIRFYVLSIE
jgi:hypothetical protein